ncbi:hypothetical protein A9P82_06590 [Arachidicoccus ginsenosidimutans]|uniref:hypothetical protein n=1 Tax=Arachidicoccus sp. BS20 TaxID=1850526 RepID=UPI0007F0986C|nr:hypothetical protein [Arachidicoccus sp. BS20]ANI88990.1 hypothetical protein A9P82_06590 [Arachidicoccus sp. BS20]
MQQNEMNTLSEVLENLKNRSCDVEFLWNENSLVAGGKNYEPQSLQIIKTYRFEGDSNPDDSAILYVLKTNDGVIGYSLDSYGANLNYDEAYNNFIRQIPISGHNEQLKFEL